jgi:hypothetical protein
LWGNGALTDIRQSPIGDRNYGAWTPQHGGGWQWTWGAHPDPNLVGTYGASKLTDPDHTPNGADTSHSNTPPPSDVLPPDVTDTWAHNNNPGGINYGVPPDVTGAGGTEGASDGQPPHEPPVHPAFKVSPGSIRNAERHLITNIDQVIDSYTKLKSATAAAKSGLYTTDNREMLINLQDRLLLGTADALELAGHFTEMLNKSAQAYARADRESFMPLS